MEKYKHDSGLIVAVLVAVFFLLVLFISIGGVVSEREKKYKLACEQHGGTPVFNSVEWECLK